MVLLGLVLASAVLYYLRHGEDFQLMTIVSIWAMGAMLILNLVLSLCRGLELKLLTDHYGLGMRFPQWVAIPVLSTCANLLIPLLGGTSFKAVYLKKIHDLRYSSFVACLAIASLIRLLVAGLLGTVLLVFLNSQALVLLLVSAAVLTGTALFLLFGHHLPDRLVSFWPAMVRVLQEWRKIRKDHGLILQLALLNGLIFVLAGLSTLLSFQAFGLKLSLAGSGIINALSTISRAPNLIPGNLGFKEALFIFISGLEGITVNQALHASIVHRLIGTGSTLLLAPFCAHLLTAEHPGKGMAGKSAGGG